MMQTNGSDNTTLAGIFRLTDPLREILRDLTATSGHHLSLYNHECDAISQVPGPEHSRKTILTARAASFSAEGMTALERLLDSGEVYFVMWVEPNHSGQYNNRYFCKKNFYFVENLRQFEATLKHISTVSAEPPQLSENRREEPEPGFRGSRIRFEPLSQDELNALRGTGQ